MDKRVPGLLLLGLFGCSSSTTTSSSLRPDGGVTTSPDGGTTIVADGGQTVTDAGRTITDAGGPSAPDAQLGPVLPPPKGTWGAADGLNGVIRDVSTDEAGNVWAVSDDTLYLLTPGATKFKAFTNADGLHVENFTDPSGAPAVTTLTAVGGAGPNVVYLGYYGYESSDPYGDTEQQKELGNGDKITYDPATGKITVLRYFFHCVHDSHCWEDRSVRRIVVGQTGVAKDHAFFGFNHGATHVFNDELGDHVHPEIGWEQDAGAPYIQYGESRAIAVNDDGTVWVGNRTGVGLMNWTPDPIAWVDAHFQIAFTMWPDSNGHDIVVPWGYREYNEAAAVTPDGTLWMASSTRGLASRSASGEYQTWDATPLKDAVANPDGTLWLLRQDHALVKFDPKTNKTNASPITDGEHLYVDRRVSPPIVYVARMSGVSTL